MSLILMRHSRISYSSYLKRALLGGIAYGVLMAVTPSSALAETLEDSVVSALQAHPSVEAARAAANESLEAKKEVRSDFFPTVAATAQAGRIYGDNSTSRGLTVTRGAAYSWLGEGSVSLTQPIFRGMATMGRMESADSQIASARFSLADARETLVLRTVESFISIQRATAVLALMDEYKAKIGDYRERIRQMVDDGAADAAEARQAEDIAMLLDNASIDARNQLEAALAAYREATGRIPEGELELTEPNPDLLPATLEAALAMGRQHPALHAAAASTHASGAEIQVERAAIYPEVNGELSYLERDQKDEIGGEVTDARAVIRANWDLGLGGAELARVEQSRQRFIQSRSEQKAIDRQVMQEIERAWAEMEAADKIRKNAAHRMVLNEELLKTYEVQFEGARIRLLQLMQGENKLFETRLSKINADYRTVLARYTVLASTGQLHRIIGGAQVRTASNGRE